LAPLLYAGGGGRQPINILPTFGGRPEIERLTSCGMQSIGWGESKPPVVLIPRLIGICALQEIETSYTAKGGKTGRWSGLRKFRSKSKGTIPKETSLRA
jgi:hypothetical protein